MEPMEAFFHPHARFIKMNHIRGQNRRFDLFLYGCKGLIHARIGRHGGTFIERTAPQVAHELFDLPQRQFVVVVQQDAQRLDPATVLNGLAHFGRKGTKVLSATTDDHAQLMLRDIHTWLRKVENLSSLFHENHIGSTKRL